MLLSEAAGADESSLGDREIFSVIYFVRWFLVGPWEVCKEIRFQSH